MGRIRVKLNYVSLATVIKAIKNLVEILENMLDDAVVESDITAKKGE